MIVVRPVTIIMHQFIDFYMNMNQWKVTNTGLTVMDFYTPVPNVSHCFSAFFVNRASELLFPLRGLYFLHDLCLQDVSFLNSNSNVWVLTWRKIYFSDDIVPSHSRVCLVWLYMYPKICQLHILIDCTSAHEMWVSVLSAPTGVTVSRISNKHIFCRLFL